MKKRIRLSERDLTRLIKKIINEQVAPENQMNPLQIIKDCSGKNITDIPMACKKMSTPPSPQEIMGCVTSLGIDPMKIFQVADCVGRKMMEMSQNKVSY
jgi:hypothetical protein